MAQARAPTSLDSTGIPEIWVSDFDFFSFKLCINSQGMKVLVSYDIWDESVESDIRSWRWHENLGFYFHAGQTLLSSSGLGPSSRRL